MEKYRESNEYKTQQFVPLERFHKNDNMPRFMYVTINYKKIRGYLVKYPISSEEIKFVTRYFQNTNIKTAHIEAINYLDELRKKNVQLEKTIKEKYDEIIKKQEIAKIMKNRKTILLEHIFP